MVIIQKNSCKCRRSSSCSASRACARSSTSTSSSRRKEDDVVDALFAESVDGYFYREERDYRGIYRILNAQIQERARTPFYDALKNYVWMAKDQWHTPGHSSGESLRGSPWVNDFYEFMGEHVFDADLSVSVPMLDSLMEPKGVIGEAQAMAAKAFGARRTFATNGTSTANKVIFQTLLAPGEKLLLDRNCHKSVHHGVVLSGAHPIYLDSALNSKYGLYGPVPEGVIECHQEASGRAGADPDLVHLRRPALRPGADHRRGARARHQGDHRRGLVRLRALPSLFPPTALEAGADYATQSTHKVLSAFSQASMIHVNDRLPRAPVPRELQHAYLDQPAIRAHREPRRRPQAGGDGGLQAAVAHARAGAGSAQAHQLDPVFRVLELEDLLPEAVRHDGIKLDPTKVTIDISGCGYTVEDLQKACSSASTSRSRSRRSTRSRCC